MRETTASGQTMSVSLSVSHPESRCYLHHFPPPEMLIRNDGYYIASTRSDRIDLTIVNSLAKPPKREAK